MMKILLAIKEESDGKLVGDFAANYSWPPGTRICVVHVTGSCPDDYHAKRVQQAARDMLEPYCQRLSELVPAARIEFEVLSGSPALEIVQMAERWQANMIVMGQRTAVAYAQKPGEGSVSKIVAMEAPCSLAIIRPPQEAEKEDQPDELLLAHNQ